MKKFLYLILFIHTILLSQYKMYDPDEHYLIKDIDKTLFYAGLGTKDITLPLDTIDYANTNQSKQLLPIVYRLMTEPLYSLWFIDSLMAYKDMEPEEIIIRLFKELQFYSVPLNEVHNFSNDINSIAGIISEKISMSNKNSQSLLEALEISEREYLKNHLDLLYEIAEGDYDENDVFRYNAEQDSASVISKRVLDILSKLDKKLIYENSISDYLHCSSLYDHILKNKNNLNITTGIKEFNYNGIRIAIGGTEDNLYKGEYNMIIDLGGNDKYELNNSYSFENNFNCIIDITGNDYYFTEDKFTAAGALFSSGFIFDREGKDVYRLGSSNLASAVGGLAFLLDEAGDDFYEGQDFSVAAGLFGCGVLYDREGNDVYSANTFSQGFGMTCGAGALVDLKGNDSYIINPKNIHAYLYSDHYLSMVQGYGYGLRPYYAGGLGYIIEGEGNDVYSCDIFGQGGSYWYALGCIADKSGHDKYNGFHYNQGSGIHYSVGLLKDYDGWDYYFSNWVSQGCGHDYAYGLLWDVNGNDIYGCDGLSQGAGNANGIGILIDEFGRDGYLSKDFNTQGYGSPSRGFGSIGVLMDRSGNDFYSSNKDTIITKYSTWGVKIDDIYPAPVQVVFDEEQKIDVDSSREYTIEELYIMARILETKYADHSQYGIRKLIMDSVNTANYILSKVSSEDIRDIVLIRNLVPSIGWTMSRVFINRIKNNKADLTQDEINFMIFMMGESKNIDTKDILYDLTFDNRYRVRGAAVTALSKLDLTQTSAEFKEKLFNRIKELVNNMPDRKMYNKDLTLALRLFEAEKTIPLLMQLLRNDFYAVRFNAAETLKGLGDMPYERYVNEIKKEPVMSYSYLQDALLGLGEENFRDIISLLKKNAPAGDHIINEIIKEILRNKLNSVKDKSFAKWLRREMKDLN